MARDPKPSFVPPLRFDIGDRGQIGYPLLTPDESGGAIEDWPTLSLPQTIIVGADLDSVEEAAKSGDLSDIRLLDGTEPYVHHSLVENFEYALSPVPTLTLTVATHHLDARPTMFCFVDAIITDWTTDQNYQTQNPHHELCEFRWDGRQYFVLEFYSFKIILRARQLVLEPQR